MPHDEEKHGKPAAVLPLLAQVQEHKETTPVRPCLDYRCLNESLQSEPGLDAVVCPDTLRKWQLAGDARDHKLLDIRKAYLNVRVAPELLRYQTVVWKGALYVMTRMGFGLSIAPKFMDIIVRWLTQEFVGVDNYIDDLLTPSAVTSQVSEKLEKFGLPTKAPEPMSSSRALGLRLAEDAAGQVCWSRREDVDLALPELITKRAVFSWCGRLTSHIPVCGWLRPACSFLKRLASATEKWDVEVPEQVQQLCREVEAKLSGDGDPAHGIWHVRPSADADAVVWCDASDLALDVVLEVGGHTVEDQAWLRPADDKRHINISELDAAIHGLSLAAQWGIQRLRLMTDSKTAASWLRDILSNRRVKTTGLHKVMVQRRLQIISDIVTTTNLELDVQWVPSQDNQADDLTRVPTSWMSRVTPAETDGASAAAAARVVGPVSLDAIVEAQFADDYIQDVIDRLQQGRQIGGPYSRIQNELVIDGGVLYRCVKLPVEGVTSVPVMPDSLVGKVVKAAHVNSGHGAWETMYKMIRARCYFPGIDSACYDHVKSCSSCAAANPAHGPAMPPTRASVPGSPWTQVTIDTLELGTDRSGHYHCVLVCVDSFTKWVEVEPLRRHHAISVANAFTKICTRWGAPEVVRVDNGSEFANAIVDSVFRIFGVRVSTGAVRHPQSQGGAERFNRTLLGLIRKVCDESGADWKDDLDVLVHLYRTRPHNTTGIPPMQAMVGWMPRQFLVEDVRDACALSEYVSLLNERSAPIRDVIEEELSTRDFLDTAAPCPYLPGHNVMLLRSDRRQKRSSPFEKGWVVSKIISPSTVVIRSAVSPNREKVVNVALLKHDPSNDGDETSSAEDEGAVPPAGTVGLDLVPAVTPTLPAHAYNLRRRSAIQQPVRFCEEF